MTYDQTLEAYTNRQIDYLFSTRPEYIECPMCEYSYREDADVWFLPHPCAEGMESSEAFVCSGKCRDDWQDKYWEEIEEYNYVQEFNTLEG